MGDHPTQCIDLTPENFPVFKKDLRSLSAYIVDFPDILRAKKVIAVRLLAGNFKDIWHKNENLMFSHLKYTAYLAATSRFAASDGITQTDFFLHPNTPQLDNVLVDNLLQHISYVRDELHEALDQAHDDRLVRCLDYFVKLLPGHGFEDIAVHRKLNINET